MIAGDYGVIWRNDGANTYLLMTDTNYNFIISVNLIPANV
ncbi:hypothetical protein ACT453_54975 [Bacillus sp. D-CC]